MSQDLTRRDFIKSAAVGLVSVNALGLLPDEKIFAADNCTVKTRYGTFNGFVDENGVKTWLGIPYAKPPIKLSTQKNSASRLCRPLTTEKLPLYDRKAKIV